MKKRNRERNAKMIPIILTLLLIIEIISIPTTIAVPNNPGHDTLYVTKSADSEITGNLNITQQLKVTNLIYSAYLDILGNGSQPTGSYAQIYTPNTGGNLVLNAPTGLYLLKDAGSMVYIGGSSVDLNVSRDAYIQRNLIVQGTTATVGGKNICLADGTNCQAVSGASIAGGWTNDSENTTTTMRVGIGTTSPNYTLDVARGNIKLGNSSTMVYLGGTTYYLSGGASLSKLYTLSLTRSNGAGNPDVTGTGGTLVLGAVTTDINQVVLKSGGNVGIGTLNPTQKLDINGSLNISGAGGTIYVGNAQVCLSDGTNCASTTTTQDGTGGNITHVGGYTIHTFTSNGTFNPGSYVNNVEVLVVGGGGGGGGYDAGGGGAGGLVYNASYQVTGQTQIVTIGNGGAGGNSAAGTNGENSVFGTITALGGGGGGAQSSSGKNGGSGGGGGGYSSTPNNWGNATQGNTGGTGFGNNGGYGEVNPSISPGAGGGAGGAGACCGSNGGVGKQYSISGYTTYYAGGGGARDGIGGAGGGGAGGNGVNGVSGTPNTGGGGGAAYLSNTGGSGGSGIIIVRYLTPGGQWTTDTTGIYYSNGNVSIGTTNTTKTKLYVNGSINVSSGNDICIEGTGKCLSSVGTGGADGTGGWINNSQNTTTTLNVGIGTTSPGSSLETYKASGSNSIMINTLNDASTADSRRIMFTNGTTQKAQVSHYSTLGMVIGTVAAENLTLRTGDLDRISILSSGNVGIGTTTPSSRLNVIGNVNITGSGYLIIDRANSHILLAGASSNGMVQVSGNLMFLGNWDDPTKSIKINLSSGNVGLGASNYINWASTDGASGYGFRDNSGTIQIKNSGGSWTNVPTSGTTQWTNSGSDIYFNTGNVGIGTTAHENILDVAGSFRASNETASPTAATTGTGVEVYYRNDLYSGYVLAYDRAGGTYKNLTLGNGVRLDANGNVGIGTNSPANKLDVTGTIRSTEQTVPTTGAGTEIIFTGGTGYLLAFNRSSSIYLPLDIRGSPLTLNGGNITMATWGGGNVGIGTLTPTTKLDVNGSVNISAILYASNISSNSPLNLMTAGTTRIFINDTTGYVGIGTTTPNQLLHIAGNINISGNLSISGSRATINGQAICLADGTNCQSTSSSPTEPAAGGTITDVNGYRIHSFTTNGTFSIPANGPRTVEVLVVAGGGGTGGAWGGFTYNAGGGGGQVISNNSYSVTPSQTITITVGDGGSASDGNGSNSIFGSINATHGNAGYYNANGGNSGSGNAGGLHSSGEAGAGGGGAGGVGSTNSGGTEGAGGAGVASSITGSSATYGAGGKGGSASSGDVPGGTNTGKGGGGTYAAGGSGIIIVRYPYTPTATWQINTNNTYYTAGNVSIGTTNTTKTKLYVNGSINVSSGNDICIEGTGKCLSSATTTGADGTGGWTNTTTATSTNLDVNINSGKLYVNATSGNVGIGLTNATSRLHIYGGDLKIETGYPEITMYDYDGAANYYFAIDGANDAFSVTRWIKSGAGAQVLNLDPVSLKAWVRGLSVGSGYFSTNPTTDGMIVQGNVGIGVASPATKLHVNGSINVTSGYDICIEGTGKCLSSAGSGSGTGNLSLSATTGYITQVYNATLLNNSAIYQNGTNVGIGTTAPAQKLHLLSTTASIFARMESTNAGSYAGIDLIPGSGAAAYIDYGTTAGNDLQFYSYKTGVGNTMILTSSGNLGIGTSTPTQKLDVNGSINISGTIFYGGNLSGYGADFAERFTKAEEVNEGDVVCLTDNLTIKKCSSHADNSVIGVVSLTPTIIGNSNAPNSVPIGIIGIVETNVKGPIKKGELLTTSEISGFAVKATNNDFGSIIGKAMEPCKKQCRIKVLITLR